jgi:hypothetical protein
MAEEQTTNNLEIVTLTKELETLKKYSADNLQALRDIKTEIEAETEAQRALQEQETNIEENKSSYLLLSVLLLGLGASVYFGYKVLKKAATDKEGK